MTTYSVETRQTILKLRQKLAKPADWAHGEAELKTGDCLITAMEDSSYLNRLTVLEILRKAIGLGAKDQLGDSLIRWNDAPERTWEEVDAALDRAVELVTKSPKLRKEHTD